MWQAGTQRVQLVQLVPSRLWGRRNVFLVDFAEHFCRPSSATWSNFSISKPISEPLVVVVLVLLLLPGSGTRCLGQGQGQAGKS